MKLDNDYYVVEIPDEDLDDDSAKERLKDILRVYKQQGRVSTEIYKMLLDNMLQGVGGYNLFNEGRFAHSSEDYINALWDSIDSLIDEYDAHILDLDPADSYWYQCFADIVKHICDKMGWFLQMN